MSLLALQGVSACLNGVLAVEDLSLAVEDGELLGLIGPNGAGKTTVFNLISGVYRPSHGEIRFRGEPITHLPPWERVRRGIARTFQTVRLFRDLPVLDNVLAATSFHAGYGPVAAFLHLPAMRRREAALRREARDLLALFGLAEAAGRPAGTLPYGDQRRLEIVRAIATRPKLLLLDEPAAGMNPAEALRLMELIGWLREHFSLTICLIEHRMPVVMGICQRVVVLHAGRLLASGPPGAVRRDPRVLEAYLGRGQWEESDKARRGGEGLEA